MFLEILHAPFRDGTPRHPLVTIEIPKDLETDVENRLCSGHCESDNTYDYWQICHVALEMKQKICFATLMDRLGIDGSLRYRWINLG